MRKLLFILLLLNTSIAFSQQIEEEDNVKNEKIESLKIAFITERLALTPKEAEVFWPVFNRFEKEMKAIRNKQRENIKVFKNKPNITDQEADKFIAEQMQYKQQEVDLLKKYLPEFKKVLPSAKIAKLLSLEQEFKIHLLQKIKERKTLQR